MGSLFRFPLRFAATRGAFGSIPIINTVCSRVLPLAWVHVPLPSLARAVVRVTKYETHNLHPGVRAKTNRPSSGRHDDGESSKRARIT